MCGIAGQFGVRSSGFAEWALAALRSRGPDGSGVWQSRNATLVHTRLAILDLSEGGKQPMGFENTESGNAETLKGHEASKRCVIVFNGEIYNYRELRAELEGEGERFASDSDTEVLLRLLVSEGEACLPRLAGMFAFAYWNEEKKEALLARDPFGIKPLYYRTEDGSFSFASTVGLLRREGDAADTTALRDYFLWGSVPEPATLNTEVRQVPAGHWLKWKEGEEAVVGRAGQMVGRGGSPRRGQIETTDKRAACPTGCDLPDAVVLTREALLESVRRHLVSDVPVGVFLSGGIDSTVLLALMREELGAEADIRTFSIGFDDPAFDESSLARRTAEQFGAKHTEWRMTQEEGAAEISAFLEAMDQPSIDGFNTWCVSKLARREGMKVVMSGLGGDEVFAGYGSFERVPRFRRFYRVMGPLRGLVARVLERKAAGSPWRRLAAFLRGSGSWVEAYHAQRGIFTAEEAAQLALAFGEGIPAVAFQEIQDLSRDPREAVSQLELSRYMRNQLLRDSDVFSMAHGLELRVPLVDARLFEKLSTIPPEIRLRQGKQLLLEAVPEVPEWIRNQPKRGFRFPFQQWMEGQFGELLAEAQERSPVPLNAWYRTWAVAAAMNVIHRSWDY